MQYDAYYCCMYYFSSIENIRFSRPTGTVYTSVKIKLRLLYPFIQKSISTKFWILFLTIICVHYVRLYNYVLGIYVRCSVVHIIILLRYFILLYYYTCTAVPGSNFKLILFVPVYTNFENETKNIVNLKI